MKCYECADTSIVRDLLLRECLCPKCGPESPRGKYILGDTPANGFMEDSKGQWEVQYDPSNRGTREPYLRIRKTR